MWQQKSISDCLLNGDRNTRYFHTRTIVRRRKNRVKMIRNPEGEWIDDVEVIKSMAADYYINIFKEDNLNGNNVNSQAV